MANQLPKYCEIDRDSIKPYLQGAIFHIIKFQLNLKTATVFGCTWHHGPVFLLPSMTASKTHLYLTRCFLSLFVLLMTFAVQTQVIIRPMFSIEHGSNSHNSSKDFKSNQRQNKPWATITQCDLLPRFFCNDATLLCEIESDKIWINEFEWNCSQ